MGIAVFFGSIALFILLYVQFGKSSFLRMQNARNHLIFLILMAFCVMNSLLLFVALFVLPDGPPQRLHPYLNALLLTEGDGGVYCLTKECFQKAGMGLYIFCSFAGAVLLAMYLRAKKKEKAREDQAR